MLDSLVANYGVHLGAILTCDAEADVLAHGQIIAALIDGRFVDKC